MLEAEEAKLEEGGSFDVPLDFNLQLHTHSIGERDGLVLLMGRISDPADV